LKKFYNFLEEHEILEMDGDILNIYRINQIIENFISNGAE